MMTILQNFSILNYIITLRYIIQFEANSNRRNYLKINVCHIKVPLWKFKIKSRLQFKQTNFQRLKHTIAVRQTEPYCLNCKHAISTKIKLQSNTEKAWPLETECCYGCSVLTVNQNSKSYQYLLLILKVYKRVEILKNGAFFNCSRLGLVY